MASLRKWFQAWRFGRGRSGDDQTASGAPVIAVPRTRRVEVDGHDEDWARCGYRVALYADHLGAEPDPRNFAAEARLGWNEDGLLICFHVVDKEPIERDRNLWMGDSVEIFLNDRPGGRNRVQIVIAPGVDELHPELRYVALSMRGTRPLAEEPVSIRAASRETDTGYVVEALIPLHVIGCAAETDIAFGLDLAVNNGCAGKRQQLSWHPIGHGASYRYGYWPVRLSTYGSDAADAAVKSVAVDEDRWKFMIFASSDYAGQTVTVRDEDSVYVQTELVEQAHRSGATFDIRAPRLEDQPPDVGVWLGDRKLAVVNRFEVANVCEHTDPVDFRDVVYRYQVEDWRAPFAPGGVVFTGHSQIHMWDTLENDMQPHRVLNRGLSGSRVDHILQFLDLLVLKHQPEKVVVFTGSNDLRQQRTPESVVEQFEMLISRIQQTEPAPEVLIATTPENAALENDLNEHLKTLNKLLRTCCQGKHGVTLIELADVLADESGVIPPTFFKYGGAHYSPAAHARMAPRFIEALNTQRAPDSA